MSRRGRFLALLAAAALGAAAAQAKPLVVDDFDGEKDTNLLNGGANAWFDPEDASTSCRAEIDRRTRLGDSGGSLKLTYDVDTKRQVVHIPTNVSIQNPASVKEDAYNGYYTVLNGADVTAYKFLNLSVKGDAAKGFTRTFKLELKDAQGASGVLVEGVTDKWQNIAVPLSKFREIRDWAKLKELVIVFGPPVVTRKEGVLYVDDIYFSEKKDERVRVTRRAYEAARADEPPQIDGALTEWPEPSYADMSKTKDFLESGAAGGRGDLAAWFAVSWDDDYLYVAVDVQDSEPLNGQSGEWIWRDDCVEFYVDPTDEGLVWGDPTHFQLGFSPTSAAGEPARWAWFQKRAPDDDEVRSVTKKYKDGYQIEAALAWTFLGMRPVEGQRIGFSAAVHDRDALDRTREGKLNWSFAPGEKTIRLGTLVLQ